MIGAVLAGGRSRRFGGDKLLVRIDGKPLILHTIERLELARGIDRVVIIPSRENTDRIQALGYDILVDTLMIGPIGGIYTALSLGDVFVVAGDMPLIVPDFIDFIIDVFQRAKKPACVPRWANGYLEPLHAAYSQDFLPLLGEKIEGGNYAINQAVRESDSCYVDIDELPEEWRGSLFNVNTRGDVGKLMGRNV
ncbi:molybdenum cofactor guanylyltransferase MobA [Thermococcus camini]|uniref:Probable molybdenum cofactor guanylyltransferase n=1 Tax=Thermococcus camini TaxID=2016373 RepID=A0A7G2DAU6_9EURY|nr:molybdenum cofactor guanylyltransferase MobA [Thermococcus camini]CAD5245120.1 putative molybdenum cofactor guanylyltransferase [Thermococcus camini]